MYVFVDRGGHFMGVTIDSIHEYIYTAVFEKLSYRAKLDGSSFESILTEGKMLKIALTKIRIFI